MRMKLLAPWLLVLPLVVSNVPAQTYNWTTIAGLYNGPGSVDGTGSTAFFNAPQGLAVDGAGNIYVADGGNYTIRKITPAAADWVVTTIAGKAGTGGTADGTGNAARFNSLSKLVLDAGGVIYTTDYNPNNGWSTIRRITPAGNWAVTTIPGTYSYYPLGLALDAAGNIYTTSNYMIIKLTSAAGWRATSLAGFPGVDAIVDGTNNAARFDNSQTFAVDGNGNIFLADGLGGDYAILREITPSAGNWVVTTLPVARIYFSGTVFAAMDSSGNIYYTSGNTVNKAVLNGASWAVSTIGGLAGTSGGADGPGSTARFSDPAGVVVDSSGNIYVADSQAHTIRRGVPMTGMPLGALQVNLATGSGTNTSAYWRVDAGNWHSNGETVTNLLVGSHIVVFAPVYGWTTPTNQVVVISSNQTTTAIGTYLEQFGSLRVNGPAGAAAAGAQWQLDEGSLQDMGTSLFNLTVGSHSLTFLPAPGWITPSNQSVIITPNSTTVVTGNYIALGSLQVNISPPGATNAGAQWQLDGGELQNSGTVLSNLALGSHIIAYEPAIGFITPSNQTVTIASGLNIVTSTYVALGSIQVTINPASVITAGAQWQLDGGPWQNSGVVISNVSLGSHTIGFAAITGWVTPAAQAVALASGQTIMATGAYAALGSLQVTINPVGAATAGAQWQLDGGLWQNSGTILSNLALGSHAVVFSPLNSWTKPTNQVVTINSGQMAAATGIYLALGSLQVGISPAGAVNAGAKWQVDAGPWQNSGATVTNLPAGSHTVAFSSLPGWTVPASQSVTVNLNQTTMTAGIYLQQYGFLQVLLSPAGVVSAGAQWQMDGGPRQPSGASLTNVTVGSHTVEFSAISGWTSPTNQTVAVASNQTARITGVYTAQGAVHVTLLPTEAAQAGAKWQVDSGAWLDSGATAAGLNRGTHTVSFKTVSGWVAPASQAVTLFASQTTSTTGIYAAVGYLFSTIAGLASGEGFADGTNGAARFSNPAGVVVDTAGNLYLADTGNSVIRKLASTGTNWAVTTIAGLAGSFGSADGTNSDARFNYPVGLAVDSSNNLYVTDQVNSTIRKLTPAGTNWVVSTIAGVAGYYGTNNGTGSSARFYYPAGIAVDSACIVYVADQVNSTIRKLAPVGTNWVVSTIAGLAGSPGGANGTNTASRFYWPGDIAVDSSTNLYVADTFNSTIRKLSPVGTNWVVTTIAGQLGFPGSADGTNNAAQFNGPTALAVGGGGDLYVADTYNSTIRKLTSVGTNWVVNTIGGLAGSSGATDGTNSTSRFDYPQGVAVDNNGSVYVADTANATVRQGVPYVAAPIPAFAVGIESVNGAFLITWDALPGRIYQLQYKASEAPVGWSNLGGAVTATNGAIRTTDACADLQRFYRVALQP